MVQRIFFVSLSAALVVLAATGSVLLWRLFNAGGRLRHPRLAVSSSRGTVIVEFALVMPIVAFIMGMVVQLTLLANASLVVRYAAFSAARSAIVRLEFPSVLSLTESLEIEPEKIEDAAELVLASISPPSELSGNPGAEAIRDIHAAQNGPWGSRSYLERMTYARAATTVTSQARSPSLIPQLPEIIPTWGQALGNILGIGLPQLPNVPSIIAPREVTVTVQYKFLITIPGLSAIPGLTEAAPAGVSGRVFTIRQAVRLQSIGPRQSNPAALLPISGNSWEL